MSDLLDDRPAPQRPGLTQVRNENLSHLVYESIRDAIINRSLPPGARRTETKLAEELNVSKTPVREALFALVGNGLAEIQASGAVTVRVLDPARAKLYSVRGMSIVCPTETAFSGLLETVRAAASKASLA